MKMFFSTAKSVVYEKCLIEYNGLTIENKGNFDFTGIYAKYVILRWFPTGYAIRYPESTNASEGK